MFLRDFYVRDTCSDTLSFFSVYALKHPFVQSLDNKGMAQTVRRRVFVSVCGERQFCPAGIETDFDGAIWNRLGWNPPRKYPRRIRNDVLNMGQIFRKNLASVLRQINKPVFLILWRINCENLLVPVNVFLFQQTRLRQPHTATIVQPIHYPALVNEPLQTRLRTFPRIHLFKKCGNFLPRRYILYRFLSFVTLPNGARCRINTYPVH